jgi:hypothetical protein
VSLAEDEYLAGDLGPGGEDEPFGAGVRAGTSGRDLGGFDTGAGEDSVEGFGELPGAVADQNRKCAVRSPRSIRRLRISAGWSTARPDGL